MDGIEGDCVCGSGCLFLLPEILQLAHPIAITSSTAALYQPHLSPQSPPDHSVASTGNHPPRQPTRSICHMPTCSLPTSILIFPLFRQPAIRSSPFPLPLLRLPPSLPSFTAWDWTFALKLQKNLTPECCILGPPQLLNIKEQYGADPAASDSLHKEISSHDLIITSIPRMNQSIVHQGKYYIYLVCQILLLLLKIILTYWLTSLASMLMPLLLKITKIWRGINSQKKTNKT